MYQTRRNLLYVPTIIAVLVLPTAATLGWYQVTRDPNLRPLGITDQALREFETPGAAVELVTLVDWPASRATSPARRKLADDLTASFTAKGVETRLVFRETEGPPQVTYVIGSSVIGPYPPNRAGTGINAAVDALRMH